MQDLTHANQEIFFTKRLIIRAANLADIDLYYELWTNPQVMHFVGFPRGLRITREEIATRLERQPEAEFERLLVVTLKTGTNAIGECLMHRPDPDGVAEPDVKLLPEFWGRGYGFEVWEGLVAHLFEQTGCRVVQSTPNVENTASINMMEKAGMVRTGEAVYNFPEAMQAFTTPVHYYIYQLKRENWERRHEK